VIAVQVFDQPFVKVIKQLPRLSRLGFSHILVSPPQKSHASRTWWGRYQPVDFTQIEGPLGSADDLRALCWKAREHGLAIVADTVLHHLSNESQYVKMRGNRVLWAQYPRFNHNDLAGVHRLGRGRGLPILNTASAWVREQQRGYVRYLYELGVRGFRFDSAKHMDPYLFPWLLEGLPPLLNFGELVFASPDHFPTAYWRSMKAYDFPLASSLRVAFAPGGDLGRLWQPKALWGPHAVPFVNHHDLVKNRRGFAEFRVADPTDRRLAYAYVLARGQGTPLVYGADLRYAEVKAGLRFRQSVAGQPMEGVAASQTGLAFRRGPSGLVAINKSGQSWTVSAPMRPGLYRDLVTGWDGSTVRGRLSWTVAPRSVSLLTSTI
jgi:alpha-amylase